MRSGTVYLSLLAAALVASPAAADQSVPGAGNSTAVAIAARAPLIRRSLDYLVDQAAHLRDARLRAEVFDALTNPRTCIRHRAGLHAAAKQAIVDELVAQGLLDPAASVPGGLTAGVFPPVLDDGGACPHLPQPFGSAPGSTFHSHHAFPGGLAVHEAFNEKSDQSLATNYRRNYAGPAHGDDEDDRWNPAGITLDQDVIIAAPILHDWTKTIVFQWNADGSEFTELNFGGAGAGLDGFGGAAGDSQTGGHHIMAVAESMARGLSPALVVTQACAHSSPTLGNEFKVVNWLRAAAIMARVDPVKAGYLVKLADGTQRLPPLRKLGAGVDLVAAGQLNLLPEYAIHNLSDADYTLTGPAISISEVLLPQLAARYGYDPVARTAEYNWKFRNTVLAHLAGERLLFAYANGGLSAVQALVDELRAAKVL